jgi:hypothetical protein
MKLLTLLLAAFLAIPTAHAGDLPPRQRAEQFLSRLMQGDADKAYADLFAGSLAAQDPARLDAARPSDSRESVQVWQSARL